MFCMASSIRRQFGTLEARTLQYFNLWTLLNDGLMRKRKRKMTQTESLKCIMLVDFLNNQI